MISFDFVFSNSLATYYHTTFIQSFALKID